MSTYLEGECVVWIGVHVDQVEEGDVLEGGRPLVRDPGAEDPGQQARHDEERKKQLVINNN